MRSGVIFTGGDIDPAFVKAYLEAEARTGRKRLPYCKEEGENVSPAFGVGVIAADRGLEACERLGLRPDLILGDFDSADPGSLSRWENRKDVLLVRYPPEKDWTDTELAMEYAVQMGWKEITVFGAFGSRLDHVLGNIQLLAAGLENGVSCVLLDAHNRITLHDASFTLRRDRQWGQYVSMFAFDREVEGLALCGFKYELSDFTLTHGGTVCVSNEITAETAQVSFKSGRLLLLETSD